MQWFGEAYIITSCDRFGQHAGILTHCLSQCLIGSLRYTSARFSPTILSLSLYLSISFTMPHISLGRALHKQQTGLEHPLRLNRHESAPRPKGTVLLEMCLSTTPPHRIPFAILIFGSLLRSPVPLECILLFDRRGWGNIASAILIPSTATSVSNSQILATRATLHPSHDS